MDITIKNELDPLFEIFSLLNICHTENWKDEMITALNDYGLKGELFFQEHLKILEKYAETFQKYRVTCPEEDNLFENISDETSMLLLALAVENRSSLEQPEEFKLENLRGQLAYYISDTGEHNRIPDSEDLPHLTDEASLLQFMDHAEVPDEEKWGILNLLRKPDYWLTCLFDIVKRNTAAYEKAKTAVARPLRRLLERSASYYHPEFFKIAGTCAEQPLLYPSLATPLTQIILYTHGYFGLLTEEITADEAPGRLSKDAVIRQSKSISDKSKLDILCTLRDSPMYNLELSEHLGLSPSTVSHHMNALLNSGFVTVEKKEGKVYYCLHQENIKLFIANLQNMLL